MPAFWDFLNSSMAQRLVFTVIVALIALVVQTCTTVFNERSSTCNRSPRSEPLNTIRQPRPDFKKDWVKVHHDLGATTNVIAGSRLELQCDATGGPMPNVGWFKQDLSESLPSEQLLVSKEPKEDNTIRGFGLGKIVIRYIVDCVTPEHQGKYTCQAVSGGETAVTDSYIVSVEGTDSGLFNAGDCPREVAPRFTVFTLMTLQDIGNNVRIPCRAHGIPRPRVFWTKDGKILDNARFKFFEEGDMEIISLQWEDMGSYTCVAENSLGKESTSTFIYPMSTKDD